MFSSVGDVIVMVFAMYKEKWPKSLGACSILKGFRRLEKDSHGCSSKEQIQGQQEGDPERQISMNINTFDL